MVEVWISGGGWDRFMCGGGMGSKCGMAEEKELGESGL